MVGGMVEAEVVELCTDCLLGAATETESRAELAMSAIALARDLADTHDHADAVELLEAATRGAVARLDVSDLDAEAFGNGLRSLAAMHDMVGAQLCRIAAASPRSVDAKKAGR